MNNLNINRLRKTGTPKKFLSLNRHRRRLKKLFIMSEREADLMKDLSLFLEGDVLMFSSNVGVNPGRDNVNNYVYQDPNPRKLGDIVDIEESEFLNNGFSLSEGEMKVKQGYSLSFYDMEQYRRIAKEIVYGNDKHILNSLEISDSHFDDAYEKILYYIAEKCKNGREIRADFLRIL